MRKVLWFQNYQAIGLLHIRSHFGEKYVGGDAYRACHTFAHSRYHGGFESLCKRLLGVHDEWTEAAGHFIHGEDSDGGKELVQYLYNKLVIVTVVAGPCWDDA